MTPLYRYEKACQYYEQVNKAKWIAQSAGDNTGIKFCDKELNRVRKELDVLRTMIKECL